MENLDEQTDDSGAAIVCCHVAVDEYPILLAFRDAPVEPVDSGWQFLCGAVENEEGNLKIWSIREVVDAEPSLVGLVESPIGTKLSRASREEPWKVEVS